MKTHSFIARLMLLAVVLFASPLLKAQYTFTALDLLGATRGGYAVVSSNGNVLITYLDDQNNPSCFLYSGNRYTLLADITAGTRTFAHATDGTTVVGNVGGYDTPHRLGAGTYGFVYIGSQYTTVNYPNSVGTGATAVSGSNVVGTYQDTSSIVHGYIYNTGTGAYTSISPTGSVKTALVAISGTNIIGNYKDATKVMHGFLYNGGTISSISYPGALNTGVLAVSGSNIIGTYNLAGGVNQSFLYNAGTYSPITYPGSFNTIVNAVDGNNVLGLYEQSKGAKSGSGFFYNTVSKTYIAISYPGSKDTMPTAISGNLIVGTYINDFPGHPNGAAAYTNFNAIPQGFVYNIANATYTTVDFPGSRRTLISSVAGNYLVGAYEDINFIYHGFIATTASKTLSLGGSLAFGSVPAQTTATRTLSIANTGNSPVTVTGISYPNGFSGAWTGTIAPASTQPVTVTFAPTTTTSYGGTLSVTSNATSSPNTIAVSGTGTTAQAGIVKPSSTTTPYSQWTAQYSLVSGPSETPLNDGVPNLLKYLCDINPTTALAATDRAALPSLGTTTVGSSPYLTVTYRQNPALVGVIVNVQTSPDLQNWTTLSNSPATQVGNDPTTTDPIMQAQVPSTGTKLFLRLNVTSP